MNYNSGRQTLTFLVLCAAFAASSLPANAQLTPLNPGGTTQATSTAPQRQIIITENRGNYPSNTGTGYRSQPTSRMQPYGAPTNAYSGTTGFGYSSGVPLSPGFGGSVAPQPGFGYQPGVTLGPGFGAQSLQSLSVPPSSQPQRYGNDGVPVLPTLPGYAPGGYSGSYNQYPGTYNQQGTNCPPLLGGYYFSSYTNDYVGAATLPTMYSLYGSFPAYFYIGDSVGVSILPTAPAYSYDSGYLPYNGPATQVSNQYNYTVNNYYASPSGDTAPTETPQVGAVAPVAAPSYDQAFADIQNAWLTGDITPLKKHLRDSNINIAVSLQGKYTYSIKTADFATITKDAFDKLTTYSFAFTSVRKQTNGDVTGYARHIYAPANSTDGVKHTIYLSFTMTKLKDEWYLTAIDSSTTQAGATEGGKTGNGDQSAMPPVATGQRVFTSN